MLQIVETTKPTQIRLSEDFLAPYREKGDPFTSLLARSTYLTKYCRGNVETWTDTIRRVVEGNISQAPGVSRREAEMLFHLFWTGLALPPGRGLWTGGVPGIPADARYNCFYTTLYRTEDWCWVANQLMLGGGVGVGLHSLDSLPTVADSKARFGIYCREDHLNLDEVKPEGPSFLNGSTPVHRCEDSREGWVSSLRAVLEAAYAGRDLIVDVSDVRSRGEPIKTFGGVACGPGPLSNLLRAAWNIIRGARGRKITSVEALDVTNHIGLCIKSGNVRRSALITLGNPMDQDFRDAKKDFEAVVSHRHTSNNSIAFQSWGEIENFDWHSLVEDNIQFGEPGLLNLPLIRQTDPGAMGINPCGEVPLHDKGSCNLAELFPAKFAKDTDPLKALRLLTRYSLRQRLAPMVDPEADAIRVKNMRLGVGLGGICDFDWTPEMLRGWYKVCRSEADDYADELKVNRPIAVTTVKPSGCRPWYALTSTDRGLLTLEELFQEHPDGQEWADAPEGYSALQGETTSKITKTYDNGPSPVYRIRLACGLEVESTGNHQWFTRGHHAHVMKEDPRWVRADQIRLGDVLDVELGAYTNEGGAPLKEVNSLALKMRGEASMIQQPGQVTPDLAWLLGYLWGDSTLSLGKYRVRFIDEHLDNLKKAQGLLKALFGLEAKIHPASEGRNASVLEVGSKMLWHWLIKNDLFKYYSDSVDLIPTPVRASGQEEIIAFIAGLLDADGGAYGPSNKIKFTICTADSDFARHLQSVCWSVGLGVGRSHNTKGESFQAKKSMWLLTSSHFLTDRSLTLLARHSVKCAKIDSADWYFRNQKDSSRVLGKVEGIELLGEMPTYDIEVEDTHWYYAGSVKSHNTISLLNDSSPGIHAPHSPYYIRRTRIAKNDPMAEAMISAGVPYEQDVYDKSGHTWVFSFPTKAPHGKVSKTTQTLRDQFQRQVDVQEFWADNAVSATLNFNPQKDREELAACLKEYVPRLKSTSCLADAHGYAQAPYEEISEAEYKAMASGIDHESKLVNAGDVDSVQVDECHNGVCPVR